MTEPVFFAQEGQPDSAYRINAKTLQAEALDAKAMESAARRLLTSSAAPERKSQAAYMLLLAGHSDEALRIWRLVLPSQTARAAATTQLRMAQALQAQGNTQQAVAICQAVVNRCQQDADLLPMLHFALHHLGKAHMDAQDWPAATASLVQALALRQSLNQADLVASTELALKRLEQIASA